MSDIDLAVTRSKRLERLLEEKLGATGKGLHQKASSVESRLAPGLLRKLRLVATVRNKLVHEDDYKKIDDRSGFIKACNEAERELKTLGGGSRGNRKLVIVVAVLVVLVLLAVGYKFLSR